MVIGGDGGEKVEDDRTTMAMAEAAIKGGANNVSSERTQFLSGLIQHALLFPKK